MSPFAFAHRLPALVLSSACLTASALSEPARAPEASPVPVESAGVVYVQAGDTIEALAQKALGSADAADELRAFNQIAAGAQPEVGVPLVLPGPERASALAALEKADQALQNAGKVEAGTYAVEMFKRAVSLQDAALQARKAASYARAQTLAGLAAAEFAKAAAESDRRANVDLPLKLTSQHGEVQLIQDAVASEAYKKDRGNAVGGTRVVTGPGAYAALALPGGGILALGESTVVEIARSTTDQRVKTTQVVALLRQGEVEAVGQAGDDGKPELILGNGGINILCGKARFWTSRTAEGVFRLSCLENRVLLEGGQSPLELTANFGAYAGPGQNVKMPIRLPPAPVFTQPARTETTTARQRLTLAWEVPEYASPVSILLRQASSAEALAKAPAEALGTATSVETGVLAAGDHYVLLRAIDANGLKGPASAVLRITIAPNAEILLGRDVVRASRGGRNVVGPGTVFRGSAAREDTSVVAYEYSLNGGPFQREDKGITLGETGEYVIAARGVAADGKTGDAVQEIVIVDAKAPDLRVHIGEVVDFPGYGLVRSISVLVDDDTKLGKVEVSVNKAAFETYANPLKLSIEKDFRISVRALDAFGNRAETSLTLERLANVPGGVDKAAPADAPKKKSGFKLF